VHCLKICCFSCNVDISSPHRHVFCLLSSSANQKPGVNFHLVPYRVFHDLWTLLQEVIS
jgi:hypothetical protein